MLEFSLQQAPLRFGLAEGVEPHQTPFGTLMTAENVCWNESGLLEKRKGSTALTQSISGGGSISAAKRLIVRGNELALTTGDTIYSYAQGSWISRGRHPEIGLEWDTIQDSINGAKAFDVAYLSNGQLVRAWATGDSTSLTGSGDIYYDIVDDATGTVIVSPTQLDTGSGYRIRVLASGNSWVILWMDGGNLKCRTSGGTTTLKTTAHTTIKNMALDACVIGSEFVVAYVLNAGGIRLVRYTFASTPVEQTTDVVTGESSTAIEALSIAGAAGETLYIAYFDNSGTPKFKFAAANPSTLAQTVAPTTFDDRTGQNPNHGIIGVARETSTTCIVLYSHWTTASKDQSAGVTKSKSITNAGAITSGQTNYYIRLLSRPFYLNGRAYAVVGNWSLADTFTGGNNSGINGSDVFLIDATVAGGGSAGTPCRQVGKIEWLIGGVWGPGFVSQVVDTGNSRSLLPTPFLSGALSNYESWRQGVKLVAATAGSSLPLDMWRSTSIGSECFLSAGVQTSFDGIEAVGYGWAHGPYLDPSNTVASGAGGSIATGTYLYNVTAERRSATGLLYRSPIGTTTSKSVPGATTGSVTVAVVPCSLSFSQNEAGFFPIYRSVVGGTILQRLTIEPTSTFLLNAAFPSQPITIVDTKSDSDIGGVTVSLATRPALYTEGGELEDWQPPGGVTQTIHANRIWIVLGDGRTVAFSKDFTSNPGIAPGFHPTLTLQFDTKRTAVEAMDEKLIAFAEDSFCYVIGQGPAPNGQNGDFQIASVQTDVGCTNARSVVSMPDGLMFLSVRGLYLLTRDLGLAWVGRPVKDKLAAYPDVTSAVLVAAKNEIRFTCNNSNSTAGIVLVFNYVEKQWTTFKYTVGGVYGAPIADAIMWNGAWTFVTTSGVVVQENDASFLDGSTWVPYVIETAWNNAGGPLAFQSVRNFSLEGVANSNHDLTISVGFDDETSYIQTKTFAAGSPVTSIGPLESCTISIGTRRKCQSIRFKIQDATPTNPGTYPVGTGQGPSLSMLGIEVGIKKGFATKGAGNTG